MHKLWVGIVAAVLAVGVMAGAASAHHQVGDLYVDCDVVTGNFAAFSANDHPITLHVKLQDGPWNALFTTESFSGSSGTARASIAHLTDEFQGEVYAKATWPTGSSGVSNREIDCKMPVVTTLPPPSTTAKPGAPPVVLQPAPAVPVAVPPRTAG